MDGLCKIIIFVTCLVFVIGHVGCFTATNKLLAALDALEKKAASSLTCSNNLGSPMTRVDQFSKDCAAVFDGVTSLNDKCGTITAVADAILFIPGLNIIAGPVLAPLATALGLLTDSVSLILTGAAPFVNSIKTWSPAIQTATKNSGASSPVLQRVKDAAANGKKLISDNAAGFSKLACGDARSGFIQRMESAAGGKDTLPNAVASDVTKVESACGEVKSFVDDTNSKLSNNVLTAISGARTGIDAANAAFGPIQKYLDEVDKVLNTKLCLSDAVKVLEQAGIAIKNLFPSMGTKPPKPTYKKPSFTKPKKPSKGWKRRRRDVCVTVRQIMDGTMALDAGFKYAAEFLLKEVFNNVMPKLPGVNNELTNFAATLMPFKSSIDLAAKAGQMALSQGNANSFLAVNYGSISNEKAPAGSMQANPVTCSGETALSVP